jgi:hypothetical protein
MTTNTKEVKLRPLGKLLNLIESAGFKLEYQHDDLVFINNTAFLFRFDEKEIELVHLHFNIDCDSEAKEKISNRLLSLSKDEEVKLIVSNNFEIQKTEEDKEEFQIIFK